MRFHKIITTGLGTGYSPLAPGTAGSILGILVLFTINSGFDYFKFDQWSILVLDLLLIMIFLLLGVYSISKVHKIWEHDANKIVIDEVVGVWIAALLIPLQWEYYVIALVLFRFFDILKPLYIKKIDQMHNNWSVMLDDVLAGLYALIIMQFISNFIAL